MTRQDLQMILVAIALMLTSYNLSRLEERMKQQDARLDRIERELRLPEFNK